MGIMAAPYIVDEPPVWFHEVLHPDGTPYREAEVNFDPAAYRKALRKGYSRFGRYHPIYAAYLRLGGNWKVLGSARSPA